MYCDLDFSQLVGFQDTLAKKIIADKHGQIVDEPSRLSIHSCMVLQKKKKNL